MTAAASARPDHAAPRTDSKVHFILRCPKFDLASAPTSRMVGMHLEEFSNLVQSFRQSNYCFHRFRDHPVTIALQWPDDVLEQWLYDHADNASFLHDYRDVDLSRIRWDVETVSLKEFLEMPTGPSDRDCIDKFAENPSHWIGVRRDGIHQGVARCWETHGTWKRWPVLIDRHLINPPTPGLQVVEGRTRVGVLRGRHRDGAHVAQSHLAWVGRADG